LRRERPGFWLAALAAFGVAGTLEFAYFFLDDLTRGRQGTFGIRLLEEATGAGSAFVLAIGIVYLARRFPVDHGRWRANLPVHLAGFAGFTLLHTTLMWASRTVLAPLFGLGPYDYGRFPTRFFMEAPNDAIGYAIVLGALGLLDAHRVRRERERRQAELERHLTEAQLRSLRLQLQPHFLFNALNTISQTMYDDPAAADEMIGHLAELLRQSLRTTHTQEVTLAEELAILERYAAIMRARFGDDLAIALEVAPDVRRALVPSLLLQPLVENAVRHGNATRLGRGRVEVRARRIGERLELEVWDDGSGPVANAAAPSPGVGIGTTAERLHLLYGDRHALEAGTDSRGGYRVTVRLPFHEGPATSDPSTALTAHAYADR
jgi:two-component system LytT family sensor kinase